MEWLSSILQTLQVISSLLVIVLVLLQQGKGADMGAAFGSGSAGSVFGAAGAANFLSRATKWAAIIFFVTTGGLAWVAHHPTGAPLDSGIMSGFISSSDETTSSAQTATGAAVPDIGSSTSDAAATTENPAVPGVASPATDESVSNALPTVNDDSSVPSVPTAPAN